MTECKAYFKRKNFHKDSGPLAVYKTNCVNLDDEGQESAIRDIQDFGNGQIVYGFNNYNSTGCREELGFLRFEFYFSFDGENRLEDLVYDGQDVNSLDLDEDKKNVHIENSYKTVVVDFLDLKANDSIGRVWSNNQKKVKEYNKVINTDVVNNTDNSTFKCSKKLTTKEVPINISSSMPCKVKYSMFLANLLAVVEKIPDDLLQELRKSLKLRFLYRPNKKRLDTFFCPSSAGCTNAFFYKM